MAVRSPSQLAWRRRVESGVRLVAPVLDAVLWTGERISRVAGRGQPDPEPPRRMGASAPGRDLPPLRNAPDRG